MRLSEAIRLGAMITRPDRSGAFANYDPMLRQICQTCAMGAAFVALTGLDMDVYIDTSVENLASALPIMITQAECPVQDCKRTVPSLAMIDRIREGAITVADVASHLYEDHRWEREEVADWVETIEQALEVKEAEAKELVSVQD